MKKYLLQLSALLLLAVTFAGCEEDRVYYDEAKGPVLAAMVKPAVLFGCTPTASKNVRYIDVEVSTLSTSVRAISYTIDTALTTALADEYSIDATTLVIPANSYVGKIKVTSDYYTKTSGDLAAPEKLLVLKLASVDGASLEKNDSSAIVTIFNTCDFVALPNPMTYGATVTASGIALVPDFVPVLTRLSANQFKTSSLWGPNFCNTINPKVAAGAYPAPATITVNDDLSLTVVADDPWITKVVGRYDPCTNVIKYTVSQELFQDAQGNPTGMTATVIMTPK